MRLIAPKLLRTGLLAALLAFAAPAQDPVQTSLRRLEALRGTWSAQWEMPGALATDAPRGSARPAARQLALSEDPELRRRAIEALGKDVTATNLAELLWALGDADPGVRETAAERAATLAPAALLQQVLDILVANDEASVHALDAALPELRDALADEFLRMFRDRDLPIPLRRAAAYSLGKMRVTTAAHHLAAATWDAEPTLAASSALALHALRDTQTVRDWAALRKHADAGIQNLAIQSLAELGGREAFAAIAEVAYSQEGYDSQLVEQSIRALAVWPRADCVPALIEVLKRNPTFRKVATELLQFRTGQALPADAAAWEDWYINGPAPEPEPQAAPAGFSAQDLLGHAQFVPPDLAVSF